MALVAGTTVGLIVLVAIVVAFVLLAVWQVAECVRGPDLGDRVKAAVKAVVYVALAGSAALFLAGSRKSGSSQAEDATATVIDLPLGTVLVVVVGCAVAGVGGYQIHKGWTEGFRRDLESTPSRLIIVAGKVGYIARVIALISVGIGLATAAITHKPSKSQGLDGALHSMVALPWGPLLVSVGEPCGIGVRRLRRVLIQSRAAGTDLTPGS